MRAIFISYRRDDTEGHAGRLFEDLVTAFGSDAVFMDVAGIAPGRDFRKVIDEHTASCCVLLALIGKTWITAVDDRGARRLDDPLDFVRLETASALKRDIAVIPVLVQGMRMPKPEELPDDLKDLAFRNNVELSHARWESDVQVLIDALRPLVQAAAAKAGADPKAQQPRAVEPGLQQLASIGAPTTLAPPRKRRVAWVVGLALAATGIGVAGYIAIESRQRTQVEEARTIEAERQAEATRTAQAAAEAVKAAEEVERLRGVEEARKADVVEQARKASEAARAASEARAAEAARNAEESRAAEDAARARRASAKAEAARELAAQRAEEEARVAEEARRAREAAANDEAAREVAAQRAAEEARAAEGARRSSGSSDSDKAMGRALDAVLGSVLKGASTPPEAARRRRPEAPAAARCISGYVWRNATPTDSVCVTPEVRSESASENAEADARREPGGGPYGPDTCRQGYVWREAFADDHVCVPPASRSRAAADNANAAARVMR